MKRWAAAVGVAVLLGACGFSAGDREAFCGAAEGLDQHTLTPDRQPSAATLAHLRRLGDLAPKKVDAYFPALADELDDVSTANRALVGVLSSSVSSYLADECGIGA